MQRIGCRAMIRKTCFFVLLGFFSLLHADPIQGIGFAAGQLSGIGLSYRVMQEKYGLQITVGAISLKEDEPGYYDSRPQPYPPDASYPIDESYLETYRVRETDANLGLLFMKTLHSSSRARLYALTGFCVFLQADTYEVQEYGLQHVDDEKYHYVPVGDRKKETEQSSTFYGGFGIGIEIKFTPNIRLALEWPLSFSSDGDFVMYIPQAGLHYFF